METGLVGVYEVLRLMRLLLEAWGSVKEVNI